MRRSGPVALLIASLLLGAGCTRARGSSVPTPVRTSPQSAFVVAPGDTTAAQARAALCEAPPDSGRHPVGAGSPSPAVASVAPTVEAARGHTFLRPVSVEAVTPRQLDERLLALFDASFPSAFYERRSRAWAAMDVIPDDYDLRAGWRKGATQAIVGFYDATAEALVYQGGSGQLDLDARFALAHELTHALDDQHFDLLQLEAPDRRCLDDEALAERGLTEGSAQYNAAKVLTTYLGQPEQLDEVVSNLATKPPIAVGDTPILVELGYFPYRDGMLFVRAMVERGGVSAFDRAFRNPPVSSEQIMHPEKYPSDRPRPVEVEDLGPVLGPDWHDLDVMEVGEAFLRAMLNLRTFPSEADRAAAGWDGGIYRAWTDGDHVAVVLRTVWDSPREADGFSEAIDGWVLGMAAAVFTDGEHVDVLFASDDGTLDALEKAAEPA